MLVTLAVVVDLFCEEELYYCNHFTARFTLTSHPVRSFDQWL